MEGPASFSAQAAALLRKNITFQGTDTDTREEEFIEPAFLSDRPLYIIQPQCAANFSLSIPIQMASKTFQQEIQCVQGLNLWRNSSSVVNDEMFKGYQQGNTRRKINEIVTEMPKSGQKMVFDLASLVGTLFFKWAIEIALAFLAATAFSHVKTAQGHWLLIMEIFPAFSLYRGLYEFSVFAFTGSQMGTSGMRWSDLNNSENGMREVLIIMSIEWVILLPLAYYLEQLTSFGGAIQRDHLSFLHCFRKKPSASSRNPSLQRHGSNVSVDMEKPDVLQERYIVEQLLLEPSTRHAIICDNLKKVYPGEDGNPDKIAVQGLSLALPRGECFGMLGPNGAGKTTFISMVIHQYGE
ncbi:ABC transporter A family member 7 [Acorus gramineus]|uniref:ABC transporter A family member 7 n=1 Tax=Acorus gramineus TaxID=55184 RepID=A0AAV9A4W6_ACOGR|nr:ABC transporter A family member 7 [Acorus gramineus]